MRKLFTNKVFLVVMVLAVALASFEVAGAVTAMWKQVTGIGNVEYTNETEVSAITVISPTKIKVILVSTALTIAAQVYKVGLYLDGDLVFTQEVSWTAGQIPGTNKPLTFTGLNLAAVTSWGVEVKK